MAHTSQRILIIGGGLAGLALGQGLRSAGVSFTIFERDEAAAFRAQGYRIRINNDGGAALKQLFPPKTFEMFEATCSEVLDGGVRVNALTGEEETWGPKMPPQHGKAWNADRTVLRRVLLSDLDDHVKFGKKFQRYELVENGIRAYFADGTCEQGTLLIGADGTKSQVRRQMLPESVLLDTEGRAVFGKTQVNSKTWNSIPEKFGEGMNMFGEGVAAPMKLLTEVMRFSRDVGVDLPQDYIYWVLVFNQGISSESTKELLSHSHSQSARLADDLTSKWHDSVRQIITQQLPEATSTLMFSMAKTPLPKWPEDKRVILIADAEHAMPPVGGVGANAAFQDAAELIPILQRGAHSDELANFETSMRDRCEKTLVQVGAGSTRFFGMKPVQELRPIESDV